jgi:hypothetical protein
MNEDISLKQEDFHDIWMSGVVPKVIKEIYIKLNKGFDYWIGDDLKLVIYVREEDKKLITRSDNGAINYSPKYTITIEPELSDAREKVSSIKIKAEKEGKSKTIILKTRKEMNEMPEVIATSAVKLVRTSLNESEYIMVNKPT